MATSRPATGTSKTVVGLFRNGEDAHRAINELVDEGFSASQIGAAFHSATAGSSASGAATGTPDPADRPLIDPDTTGISAGASGPRSGSTAVTPAGLASGSGTATTAAGRPGPIPGSEIPHRTTNVSPGAESITGAPVAARQGVTPRSGGPDYPEVTSDVEVPRRHAEEHGSWWDKLKHVFSSDESHDTNRTITEQSRKEAQNFGTGEGRIAVPTAGRERTYSGAAFEKSFSNVGIPAEHSRYLARQLGTGGAVVTVNAGSKASAAESILSRNGGSVSFESSSASSSLEDWVDQGDARRLELFGEIRRTHYERETDPLDGTPRSRKAS